MTGDEPRNVIPVDWVSEVMCHLFCTPEAHGGTYHLVPETPITPREIIEAGFAKFGAADLETRLDDAGVPASRVRDIPAAVADQSLPADGVAVAPRGDGAVALAADYLGGL